jgi:hypothetical protein
MLPSTPVFAVALLKWLSGMISVALEGRIDENSNIQL